MVTAYRASACALLQSNFFPAASRSIAAQGIPGVMPIPQHPAFAAMAIYRVQMAFVAMSVAVDQARVVMFA